MTNPQFSRPMVYIAGPYRSPNSDYLTVDHNIRVARDAAKWLVDHRIFFFCPHMHGAHFDAIAPEVEVDYWLDLDMHVLRACHALLLVGRWWESKGSLKELEEADRLKLPVFDFKGEGSESRTDLLAWHAEFVG